VASVIDLTVSWACHFIERSPEVPAISLGNQHVELIRRFGLLGRRLRKEHPLLLTISKSEGTIWVLEDVALLKHLVNLLLHATELIEVLLSCRSLLLHGVEEVHLLGDFGLLMLLLELFILDLDPGFATLGGSLHQVARFALGDYRLNEII
jgi:hypothetical protein